MNIPTKLRSMILVVLNEPITSLPNRNLRRSRHRKKMCRPHIPPPPFVVATSRPVQAAPAHVVYCKLFSNASHKITKTYGNHAHFFAVSPPVDP